MEFQVLKFCLLVAIVEFLTSNGVYGNSDALVTLDNKSVDTKIPIVIQTPQRNFDEPNLTDFENCSKNLESCKQTCLQLNKNEKDCLEECPKCPVLVIQNSVIQGVNDTDLNFDKPGAINSTTIIKLKNEIHNVIDNNLGNITARNENNVFINRRNATSGGKFGLGYTEEGPCCMVIRNRTHKQRLCGNRCKAPIMHARQVVQCDDNNDIESCKQVIEYRPHRGEFKENHSAVRNKCSYQKEWPFVNCRNRRHYDDCSQFCLELTYGYILRYGISPYCANCFRNIDRAIPTNSLEEDVVKSKDDNKWILEKIKCQNSDGTVSDDCEMGSGDDRMILFDNVQDARISAFDSLQLSDTTQRRRRNAFRRSKYSRRHRQKASSYTQS